MEEMLEKVHSKVEKEIEELLECENWTKDYVLTLEKLIETLSVIKSMKK